MSIEDDLRSALRREPAPGGFAARVLAKTVKTEATPRRPLVFALAAALAAAAVIPTGVYEYRERQRGIEARDQLVQALAITRVQLQQARGKIRQVTKRRL
jgi:hypothetical protein